jgi:hypothetical protein
MKAKKIISLLLSLVFLFSALEFSFHSMKCLSKGHKTISILEVADCCPNDYSADFKISSKCCEFNTLSIDLSDQINNNKTEVTNMDSVVTYFIGALFQLFQNKQVKHDFYKHAPPILKAAQLLFCVFLI